MPCTTILVGKNASYDGSCMIARNDDSGAGKFKPKKFAVCMPQDQPKVYESVISHVRIPLPDNPMRYTYFPNVIPGEGIWAECSVNEASVGMTATETITSNPRVLGADPLVVYDPETGKPGGIGEEDIITLVIPYVKTAREAIARLGSLLEEYGTYEMNGIGISDCEEVWYLETIGGHHWIARRVPDDCYAVMANQQSIDSFDFTDAMSRQEYFMCSKDLLHFVRENDLNLDDSDTINPRDAFGSHDDSDHSYNTPRVWFMERYFNPHTYKWDGPDAKYTPASDDLPWCLEPEKKITVEDIKYVLSSVYQGTPYDPYSNHNDSPMKGAFRPIGINRTTFLGLIQQRPGKETLQWVAFGANPFNAMVPFYSNIPSTPEYVDNTTAEVNTNNLYWTSRLIGAMADATYHTSAINIERYQNSTAASSHQLVKKYDALLEAESDPAKKEAILLEANQAVADMTKKASVKVLDEVLYNLSMAMKNSFSRSDA